jgi:hypothetical protein
MMESAPGALSATARSLVVDVMVVDVMVVDVMVVDVMVVDVMVVDVMVVDVMVVEIMVVDVMVVDVMVVEVMVVDVMVVDVMVVDVMVVNVMVVNVMVVDVTVMANEMVVAVVVTVDAHPPPILAQGVDSGRRPSPSAVLPAWAGPAAVLHAPVSVVLHPEVPVEEVPVEVRVRTARVCRRSCRCVQLLYMPRLVLIGLAGHFRQLGWFRR